MKGGYVTCEVCSMTKYYAHISRRYGVFSCESCAKFFYRHSQKPVKYECRAQGKCSLNTFDSPGGRCKACLLQACFQKYILDPKKHPSFFDSNKNVDPKILEHLKPSIKLQQKSDILTNWMVNTKNDENDSHHTSPFAKSEGKSLLKHKQNLERPRLVSILPRQADHCDGSLSSRSPSSSPQHKRSPSSCSIFSNSNRSRRVPCRKCQGCLSSDCGRCLYCLDKPKFGGQDVKKQKCLKRRCRSLKHQS